MLTLDELGHALAAAAERGAGAGEASGLPTASVIRARIRRRRTALVSAGTALTLALAGAVVAVTQAPGNQEVRTTGPGESAPPGPAGSVTALATGHWEQYPAGPLQDRCCAVLAWTGDRLLVWGGAGSNGAAFNDGAVFTPATRAWRRMSPSPLPPTTSPTGYWTGKELLVLTLAGDAAYDPGADRWRTLAPRPAGIAGVPAAAWTGRELIVLRGLPGATVIDAAAYDPAADRWRPLNALPQGGLPVTERPERQVTRLTPVWVGDRLLVWKSWKSPDPPDPFAPLGPAGVDLFSLDVRSGTWGELRPRTDGSPAGAAYWNGDEVVFDTPGSDRPLGADGRPTLSPVPEPVWNTLYRPSTNTYRRTPAAAGWGGVWTGRALVRFTDTGMEVVDPATSERTTIIVFEAYRSAAYAVVWAGDQLLAYGGQWGLWRFGP